MTAPAVPNPAPVHEDTRAPSAIMQDEALWQSFEAPLRAEDGEVPPPRDDKGRFTKAVPVEPAVEAPEDGTGQPAAEAAPEHPEAEATPEGEAEAPEVPVERKKATQFTVYDAEGEVEIPEEVQIEFKANGQTRKMPLDKVVRLAQSGFYNEQLQAEVKEVRAARGDYESRLSDMEERLQRQVALNRSLLESEDAYLQARDAYARQNTPEERARRLEAQLAQERALRQQEALAQQATAFLQGDLEPKVTDLLTQYPTVTDTEAAGWLAPQLKALEVRGVIPPQRYPEVRRLLDEDLSEWMAQLHRSRSETTRQAEATRQLQLRKAQAEAAKAKRELTKAASPARTPGAVTPSKATTPNTRAMSAKEAHEAFWKSLGYGEPDEE